MGMLVAALSATFAFLAHAVSTMELLGAVPTGSVSLAAGVFVSYPDLFTAISLGGALLVAGPLGLIGYGFEHVGVRLFFRSSDAGLAHLGIGILVIAFGAPLWRWGVLVSFVRRCSAYRR